MLATDINAPDCLLNWTNGVSPTGTFIKNAAATWDEAEVVPAGWTVTTEEYDRYEKRIIASNTATL